MTNVTKMPLPARQKIRDERSNGLLLAVGLNQYSNNRKSSTITRIYIFTFVYILYFCTPKLSE
jgi:hypothetical protein